MANDYGDYGRIPYVAFKAISSVLFALAMLALTGRLVIRFTHHGRLFIDDYVLLFGCATLIAAFTLVLVSLDGIYFGMLLNLGPLERVLPAASSPDLPSRILRTQQLSYAAVVLNWVTIFAVKLSYLLFFRLMLDGLKPVLTYWKIIVGLVAVSGCYCISYTFIACPLIGLSAIKCTDESNFRKININLWLAHSVDMLTDLLIVSIPIIVLRKVNIRLHKKIILGTFLCLSFFMFAITLVRAIGSHVRGNGGNTVDVQWSIFWQLIEACVAVMVVSLTSFRSLYSASSRRREQERQNRPWLHYYPKRMMKKRPRKVNEFGEVVQDRESLPKIPHATMTGLRSVFDSTSAFARDRQLSSQDARSSNNGPSSMDSHDDFQRNW